MKLSTHIFTAAAISIPILYQSMYGASVFFLSAVMIDIDHYIFFSIHNRIYSLNIFMVIRSYKKWSYYGPRVMFFHNYELIILCAVIAYSYGDIYWYMVAGCIFHLSCDQIGTWINFKFMRIRTLTFDLIRYIEYRTAKKKHLEKKYMIEMRDSWISHLKHNLSEQKFNNSIDKCRIFHLYPEVPIKESTNTRYWSNFL